MAARWVGSCAVVHGEHGIDTDLVYGEPRRRVLFRRVAFEMADRVLSVSGQLRELYSQRTGFPAEKITVVHNGVNPSRFFPDAAVRFRVRRELGLADDEICIGSVGHLSTVKDHMTDLRALAEVANALPGWRFLIFGEGAERPRLEAFLEAHPEWKHRVRFAGLSREMPDMLKAMDIFILASITEGMCNSLLEAMATGLPVIATRTGGNPEAVVDGESGLLFPVGDHRELAQKLLLLAARPDLRRSLGQGAIRRIRDEFSIESMVRGYERVYGSLVAIRAAA
jgi:glycosyltransferase involved in cell wall biosynthesis